MSNKDDSNLFSGYHGLALNILQKFDAHVGDRVKIETDSKALEGILIPRAELTTTHDHVVIKLKNGYNLGVHVSKIKSISVIERGRMLRPELPEIPVSYREDAPEVSIVSTGGTIASRVDYQSGAVYPALDARDLYNVVPELGDYAKLKTRFLFNIFSENITPSHWTKLAAEIAKDIQDGVDGIVVTHGTDTMGYSSAALSFALQNLPVPVVFVGSQRSSDRPSSDAAMNLLSAVITAANAPFAHVVVVMHGTEDDKFCYCHPGTKVRKNHTSKRDAFRTINDYPIAKVENGRIIMLKKDFVPRDKKRELVLKPKFDDRVAFVKTYPGIPPEIIDFFVDRKYHGIVLEGTGLGHAPEYLNNALKRAIEEGIPVVMTSQCIWGRINMYVYRTGRQLLNLGVIPGEDMLPETAYVKLMWVLAQTRDMKEIRSMMLTNFAGEITPQTHSKEFLG